jgi:hypothetical protein
MSMDRWKQEKQIKKAKKSSVKTLIKEGSSLQLAKRLVDTAYKRIIDENN